MIEEQKKRLSKAIAACIENGELLFDDARWWLPDDRSPTITALCILAQEEFAKAFLLHLVREEILPWTPKVHESLRSHKHKQLIGLIMEGLSALNDAWWEKIPLEALHDPLPSHITDAMRLYVEKIKPEARISYAVDSDRIAKSIARGDRDRIKQDALYVALSDDGEVLSVPSEITREMAEEELNRTGRLKDLVSPLREDNYPIFIDREIFLETMQFLLIDKTTRPVLVLKDTVFRGPVTFPNRTTWTRCIAVRLENISSQEATSLEGYAALRLNDGLVKPMFIFDKLMIPPGTASNYCFHISDETYAGAISNSHKLELYTNIKYQGIVPNVKYRADLWCTYDPSQGNFKERFRYSQESLEIGGR